jgi:hypothetical protein
MNTTETSLRVRFFESQGWKWKDSSLTEFGAEMPRKAWHDPEGKKRDLPILDSNTVREAMMRMTEEEWKRFTMLFFDSDHFECVVDSDFDKPIEFYQNIMIQCFKQDPTTLAELVCEVRGF